MCGNESEFSYTPWRVIYSMEVSNASCSAHARVRQLPKGDGAFDAFFLWAVDMYGYEQYEEMKRAWVKANPGASNAEYQTAMRRIAKKCGV